MATGRYTFFTQLGRALPLLLLLLCSTAWGVGVDSRHNLTEVPVSRYTANGLPSTSPGLLRVQWEDGNLNKDGRFIPTSVLEDYFLEIDQASLDAISGRFVMTLAIWTQFSEVAKRFGNSNAMKYFPRSAQTYSINGVPYVIVTPGGGSSGKPTVSISAAQPDAAEAGPVGGRFLIALDAAVPKDIKVKYALLGKARNGKDYLRITKAVLIPAGNVSAYVDIEPIDDSRHEGTEYVTLRLKALRAYKRGSSKSAKVAIADDD